MALDQYGSVDEASKLFVETWESVSAGTHYIVRENKRGDEVHEAVQGSRRFKLSSYERMITEDKIVDRRHNPFRNGVFRPIIVPEEISIDTNPNALSDDDIHRIFQSSQAAWDEYMEVIDAPATLSRMIDLADESEKLSHKRYRQLEAKHSEGSNIGKQVLASKDEEIQKFLAQGGGQTSQNRRSRGSASTTK